jgi:hypothetical protein
MPKWLTGGEFGDLSTLMNNRDKQYEDVAQSEQQTESNDFKLEEDRRKDRMREILNDRVSNSKPASIRDAYEQMINAAYESGDPMAALEYEGKKQAYEQAELNKRRADMTSAVNLADNVAFDRIEELFPGALTRSDYDRNQRRKKAESAKEEKSKILLRPDGTPERIPERLYNEYIKNRYTDPNFDDRDPRQIRAEFEKASRGANGEDGSSDSGWLGGLIPYAQKGDRVPGQGKAQGDTSRLAQPSVEDEVKVIKRKRSVEGGKTLRG